MSNEVEIIKLNPAITKISCTNSYSPFLVFLCKSSSKLIFTIPIFVLYLFYYYSMYFVLIIIKSQG